MATIDAQAALARSRKKTLNVIGECLGEVYRDCGSIPSIGPGSGHYTIAYNAWVYSAAKHPGDRNPPVAVPVVFGPSPTRTDKNKNAGDIAWSIGGGLLWVTDVYGNPGHMGIMTIAAREKQTARPYLGWMGDFLGHELTNIGPVVGSAQLAGGGFILIPIPQVNDYDWSTAMGYGYRLMGMDNLIPKTATNPTGMQLALAEMDPDPLNVSGGHRNVWVEDSLDNRREWVEYFGPIHMIGRLDSWNSRSNDPHRIGTFPADAGVTLTDAQLKAIGAGVTAGASKADVAAAVKVGTDAVIAKIPTEFTAK